MRAFYVYTGGRFVRGYGKLKMMGLSRPLASFTPLFAAIILAGCTGVLPVRSDNPSSENSLVDQPAPSQIDIEDAAPALPQLGEDVVDFPSISHEMEKDDLWGRIRQGYQLSPRKESHRVHRQLDWYIRHPEHISKVEQHARPYLHHIVEELEKRDMPLELALLPVVESAYRPYAHSPGSAAGIWQFIPSTGKMYGLKQTWWYDGRRDILASTDAALDYLESLSEQFDGDWELALAAYNAGSGAVRRAIRKNQRSGKPTDYWSLDLPGETKRYVPRLLALAEIVQTPEEYGIRLSRIPDKPFFESVEIDTQLDLPLAAELAGIDIEMLYRLNPGYNRWATDPQGPHRILLPLERVDEFNAKLSELDPDQRIRWARYLIQPGDTLQGIARKHETTVAVLKQANHLDSSLIKAGRALLIPQAVQDPSYLKLTGLRHVAHRGIPPQGNKITHIVRPGDSLWEIARSYNVSHKAVARWNGISIKAVLRPGQKLVIWTRQPALVTSSLMNGPKTVVEKIPEGSPLETRDNTQRPTS